MFRKAQFFAKLPDRRGLIVALISLVLLAALVVLVVLRSSPVFVAEPLKSPLERCSFSEDLRCLDFAFFEGAIKLVLSKSDTREIIIKNISATSEALEGGFCTTGNLDARLRAGAEMVFELDKKEDGSSSDDPHASFYADYVASSGFARYAAVDAAADYAGSSVVAAVLTAADSDGATANSIVKAARAAAGSVSSSPIGTLNKAEVRKNSVAKRVAAAVSEAAGEDNATAYFAAEAVFYDSGQYVHYPGVTYSGYDEADYDDYDFPDGVSDAADAVSAIAVDAASGVVSSVTAAARAAAVADGATADSVASAARNAAESYAAAARANASDAYSAADSAAEVAAASYVPYADSYYSDYSALELAGAADSVIDWYSYQDILARTISVEVPAARFGHAYLSAVYTVPFAVSVASYDIIPFEDADYASNYYTGAYADAYQAIADVAADSVDDYYYDSVAYDAAVDAISANPSGYEAAYKAAIDAYRNQGSVIGADQNSSYYAVAYAAAHDVISVAYATYSGSGSGDYTTAVSAFKAASDAAATTDYGTLYPDDPISAATAGYAAYYAVYRSFDAAISVYPNASTADYVTYAAYSRDAVESAYADVYARDADAVAVTAEYVAAAVAKAASGVNSAGSPVSAKSAADDIIAAAKAAAADAVSAAESAADAVAGSPDNQYVDGECTYRKPDEVDDADFVDIGHPKDLYDLELVYSWADEPGVNHVIKGELLTSAPS